MIGILISLDNEFVFYFMMVSSFRIFVFSVLVLFVLLLIKSSSYCCHFPFLFEYIFNCLKNKFDPFLGINFIQSISMIYLYPISLFLGQPQTIKYYWVGISSFLSYLINCSLKLGENTFICGKFILILHLRLHMCLWFITLVVFCPQTSIREMFILKIMLLCG